MTNTSQNSECLNCNQPLNGNYCSNCGQKSKTGTITLKETIGDFFSSTFALEGPLMLTTKMMVVDPGLLFREFLAGKRKKYYKPVGFFVVLTAVYLIVRAILDYNTLQNMPPIYENSPQFVKDFKKAAFFMVANINNILLFLALSVGINNKIYFFKKHNLTEYLTIGFYITGIYTIIGLLQMILDLYVFQAPRQLVLLFLFLYIVYTTYSFHQKRTFLSVLKYLLMGITTVILYIVFSFGFSYLVVVTGRLLG